MNRTAFVTLKSTGPFSFFSVVPGLQRPEFLVSCLLFSLLIASCAQTAGTAGAPSAAGSVEISTEGDTSITAGTDGTTMQSAQPTPMGEHIRFEYTEISGLGYEEGVTRRDPSDIIRVGDTYYVWYTLVHATTNGEPTPIYAEGYYGTVWYATSTDGVHWEEQGEALGTGEPGAFDSHAVFTPTILVYEGSYYLYYTGVKPTPGRDDLAFENNNTTDITAIGVAVSDSPDGPFVRAGTDPVIAISQVAEEFDSYRVDDARILIRDGQIRLYYKGRSLSHGPTGPRHTEMGVAFATSPTGPFTKHPRPIMSGSHEVSIWQIGTQVAALASISQSIYISEDGLQFTRYRENLRDRPWAPGLYRPHLTDHNAQSIPGWGLSHGRQQGHVYLRRFEFVHE